jgi:single-strand DNA-binding protein
MASVNKVILIGNAGRDPEVRTFPSGDKVCNVTIATTEKWKDKSSGEQKEATEWHRLVFNGRLAEIAGEYVKKGSSIYVEGSIKSRKYTDKDQIERTAVEIRVDKLTLLGSKPAGEGGGGQQSRAPAPAQRTAAPAAGGRKTGFDDMDDDIPF